jgi:toxin FitB
MKGWLLDTNVISELRKKNCDAAVKRWATQQPPQSVYLSSVTLAEIRYGIEKVTDSSFQEELNSWLENVLRPWFSGRILQVDETVFLEWRKLMEVGKKRQHTFSQPDLFIAAIALVHSLCVVTRNTADFLPANVLVLDPWMFP